jgi:membrane-associated phospholipid phosphatase
MKEIFYDWDGANTWLFHLINDIRFAWWDSLMQLGTYLGGHSLFVFYLPALCLLALWRLNRLSQDSAEFVVQARRWLAVIGVFSLAYWLDGLLLGYLKPVLDFPRPPLALLPGTLNVIGTPELHHSLPSGHSSFAMLVGASLWPLLSRRGRWLAAAFVLWVGVSRVSLGAHFPTDVLAGYLSSLAIVLLSYCAVQWLMRRAARRS